MKDFSIGQVVLVSKVAETRYDDMGVRTVATYDIEPVQAVVVGQCVKQLGKYRRASGGSFGGIDIDFQPAFLEVTGSETLWLVRTGMVNRPLMVRDDDLVACDQPYSVPRRGRRIKPINQ